MPIIAHPHHASMHPSLHQIQQQLQQGQTTVVSRVQDFLVRIEEKKVLNAFLEVFAEEALEQAKEADRLIRAGKSGKLSGMVIGIKDNLCYKGHITSAGSRMLQNYRSPYNATAIERLLEAGAIIIGRLNCDEFAMGGSNENSAFGPVLNPHNHQLVPGGSSGGSAAAVAAGLCDASLGSDTGGSIRQPSSFCGAIGLKPTYGRVSRHGLIAYASSFDQIGPITHHVEDAALLLEVIAGEDAYDSTLSDLPVPSSILQDAGSPESLAIISETLGHPSLDPEIANRLRFILGELTKEGHPVEEAHFPWLDYIVPTYYTLVMAEASSNLARYDGVHYGHRTKKAVDIGSLVTGSRTEAFGTEVKRRIMSGNFILSSGYYDAYYTQAQKVRRVIRDATNDIFKKASFMIMPCTPGTAFPIGALSKDPVQMYLQDIFTVHANMAGIPAVSLPLGRHSNGMPFGIQVCAPPFREQELLSFASRLMKQFSVLEG
jgi:aspartyl-tRNA(Asn)/glutamyl-tRNA(Gln) amidotransferase subunit A